MADSPVETAQIPHRVLIVDDAPELRLLLRARLGMEVDIDVVGEASNGVEAVRLTKVLSPSAVVLDLQMPVMAGDQAIPLLRQAAPHMGILLYTGVVAPELSEEAMPDAIVHKGVPLGDVVDGLRRVLVRKPYDVMRLDLGTLPLRQAMTAFDTWTGLNVRVLRALERGDPLSGEQLSGASREELDALMGIYAHVGQNLQNAAHAGDEDVTPVIHVFRTTGVLARGALLAFNNHRLERFWKAWGYDVPADAVAALSLMRDRLINVLPPSAGADKVDEHTDSGEDGAGGSHSATPQDRAADDRDRSAVDRDERADAHDVASEARDDRANARDERAVARERTASLVDLGAAADRAGALRDRRGGAGDRVQAEDDRKAASADRVLAAQERADASIDEVTGASARRAGLAALKRDLDRATRTQQPFTVAFVDVDDLKGKNDTLGHLAGDDLLRQTAELIRLRLRSYDVIVRFGGDEFLCGLVDVPLAEAAKRFALANQDLIALHGASVTVGMAELRAGDTVDDLIARADAAMYANKAARPGQASALSI